MFHIRSQSVPSSQTANIQKNSEPLPATIFLTWTWTIFRPLVIQSPSGGSASTGPYTEIPSKFEKVKANESRLEDISIRLYRKHWTIPGEAPGGVPETVEGVTIEIGDDASGDGSPL